MITYSIVIPIYGYESRLLGLVSLLTSIQRDADPGLMEVIIVNNGKEPDKNIEGVLRALLDGLPLLIVNEIRPGLNNARNVGASLARGEVVIFLDDDIFFEKSALNELASTFKREGVLMVSGKVALIYDRVPKKWVRKDYFSRFLCPPAYPQDIHVATKPFYVFGGCMAIRRSQLLKEGFDEKLDRSRGNLLSGGDIDIALRFDEKKVFINPNAIFYTIAKEERMTLVFFIRRFFWQGITDKKLKIKHGNKIFDARELRLGYKALRGSFAAGGFRGSMCYVSRLIGYKI